MILNPIIPIWLMAIICIALLFFKRKGWMGYIRQILIILLLFAVNLRVMVKDVEVPVLLPKVDVVFVVDNSISMFAEDYGLANGRRMDAAKEDCEYIMKKLPGASFSLVKFEDTPEIMVPFTTDLTMVKQSLSLLKGEGSLHAGGTSMNTVLDSMEDILNDGRDNYKVVFFISDGENTVDEQQESFSRLQHFTDGGAVLGYGTTKGGKMKAPSFLGSEEEPEYLEVYKEDSWESEYAISKIDEKNLKKIASDFGIDYVHMTNTSAVDHVLNSIQNGIMTDTQAQGTTSTAGYKDTYFWLLIPLAALLIWDVISFKRKA